MDKIEILSPAGDIDSLKMAIKCGCDAVYISGKKYGARKFAKNFTLDEIEQSVRYCHLYGVKLYVTVNTLVEDYLLEDIIKYIENLHLLGVDALIMQDLGLITLVREMFPNLEIHASTQTHNMNNETLKFLKSIGCTRVVLARELTLEEIKMLSEDIELEVFIHGALCICYSGCCLASSMLFGRSGNKGECSGPCRFKYDLYEENRKVDTRGNYLLSTKELCVKDQISNLIKLGITSLKIEGRMKSKYYVGYVTKFYRTLVDKYYKGEVLSITKEEQANLLKLYNREFTEGYLNNDFDIVNQKTCNHQGYLLGRILETGKRLKIKLMDDLYQGDGIRLPNNQGMICNYIYSEKGLLISNAKKGDIVYLDNRFGITQKGDIYKTLDTNLEKQIESYDERKINIDFKVKARLNQELEVTIVCEDVEISKKQGLVEEAKHIRTTKRDIEEKLSKLGNTPFKIGTIMYDMDNDIFIPMKNINNLKQVLTQELISKRENCKVDFIKKSPIFLKEEHIITNEISFLVRTESQLKYLLDKDVLIYVENTSLYNKYKDYKNVFYRASRIKPNDQDNIVISNTSGLLSKSNKNIIDIYMNAVNSLTVNLYHKSAYKVGLSPELTYDELKDLINNYKKRYGTNPNLEMLIYGKVELMIMRYCLIKKQLNKNKICNLCHNSNYYLDDRNGHRFMLLKDDNHNMRLYNYQKINNIGDISYLRELGVTNFRIDLLDETLEDIESILKQLKEKNVL